MNNNIYCRNCGKRGHTYRYCREPVISIGILLFYDEQCNSPDFDVDKPKPKVMFEPGEVVRIIDGPFNDFNGVVETVDFEKNKLKVSVLVFGKPTPIELSLTQVEKG